MRWKWNEASPSGKWSRGNRLLFGGTKVNVIIGLLALVAIGWAVAMFSRPYLRQSKFEHMMGDEMREVAKTNDPEAMITNLITDAQTLGLPLLTRDDFFFEGGKGKPSLLRVKYTEKIRLFDDKWYVIPMVAEKELNIPLEAPP